MRELLRWLLDLAQRLGRGLDWPLLLALGALMVIGLAVLDSAGGSGLVMAQGSRFAVGLVAMWAIARVPILRTRAWTPWIYALSMLPLLAVFVLGTGKYGRQWLNLGFFYLQPAELLKVSMPMMVAWYLNRMPLPPRLSTVLVAAAIIGVPTSLVMLQPDFGTAVLIAASGVFVLYLSGMPWWWFITAGTLGGSGLAVVLFAPTLGVLGAVIGLVAALGHMNDTEALGHAIAAAFMATGARGPVLDVGAGTGLLGQSLRGMGFADDIASAACAAGPASAASSISRCGMSSSRYSSPTAEKPSSS